MKRILIPLILIFSLKAVAFELPEFDAGKNQILKPFNSHGQFAREQITNSESSPYRFVGNLNGNCTGTLVGPKHVLTAAHCLYDFNNQRWYETSYFTPAMTGEDTALFGSAKVTKVHLLKDYRVYGTTEYDYAIVELDQNLGNEVGWATIRPTTKSDENELIRISGYPGDKDYGTMWSVTCPATLDKNLISYYCDTAGGMSGSSIFALTEKGVHQIIGVHTDGGETFNFGVRINSTVYRDLANWINSDLLEDAVKNFFDYCLSGEVEKVRIALESKKIFINSRFGKHSWTALAGAASTGQSEVVALLLAQPFVQVNKGAPLSLAVKAQSIQSVELLLNNRKVDVNSTLYKETALWFAVESNNAQMVKLLLTHLKIDIRKTGESGITPLQLAINRGYREISQLLGQQ